MKDLLARAEAWIEDDPDDVTREELTGVLEAAVGGSAEAIADLEDRFRGFLEFGTAGLRGAIGAGPNRMNRAVVIRAADGSELGRGLVAYDADEATRVLGKASRDIEAILGYPGRAEMIHRDDMALRLG